MTTTETVTQRGADPVAALAVAARTALDHGLENMTVWTPQGWKAPKGFPRRHLLCIPTMGGKSWHVDAARLLKWCEAQR